MCAARTLYHSSRQVNCLAQGWCSMHLDVLAPAFPRMERSQVEVRSSSRENLLRQVVKSLIDGPEIG